MIFLLEDDESIRKLIEYSLKTQQYQCSAFPAPDKFWNAMADETPDLILLDIMLPQEDGISILKKLKASEKTKGIPVIMLTAKDTEFDIVTGLDSGADDYVTKPFGMMALISRIKAVLRRYEKNSQTKTISIQDLEINVTKHTVTRAGQPVSLTAKEFDLLVKLCENKGIILTREQLLNSIWKIEAEIESRTVDVHIRTLRQKIKDEEGLIIKTVRGIGYKVD